MHGEKNDHFKKILHSEDACAQTLFRAKWPNGFRCPKCKGLQAYVIQARKLYQCSKCRHQSSLTAGTVFENTRTPLTKWFTAIYLISRPEGVSAVELQKKIKVTYKTAWTMLMKLRHAMSQESNEKLLDGLVRINSCLYGLKISPYSYRHKGEHPLMIGASLDESELPKQIKIHLPEEAHMNESMLKPSAARAFRDQFVSPDSTIVQSIYQMFHSRRCPKLVGLVKQAQKWIYDTFIALGTKHFQLYLDEFCYRFNHGNCYHNHLSIQQPHLAKRLDPYPLRRPLIRHYSEGSPADFSVLKALLQTCATRQAMTYRDIILSRRTDQRHRVFRFVS